MCYSIYINLLLLDSILIAASNKYEENNIGLTLQCDTQKHFYKLPQELKEKGTGK